MSMALTNSNACLWACLAVVCLFACCSGVSGARQSLSYTSQSDLCLKRELRYSGSYNCINNPNRLICWALVRMLERPHCTSPCNKFADQQCVSSGETCTTVAGLCNSGQKCCSTK